MNNSGSNFLVRVFYALIYSNFYLCMFLSHSLCSCWYISTPITILIIIISYSSIIVLHSVITLIVCLSSSSSLPFSLNILCEFNKFHLISLNLFIFINSVIKVKTHIILLISKVLFPTLHIGSLKISENGMNKGASNFFRFAIIFLICQQLSRLSILCCWSIHTQNWSPIYFTLCIVGLRKFL